MQKTTRAITLVLNARGEIEIPANAPWVLTWIVTVDTFQGAAADDLERIRGAKVGDAVILQNRATGRTVVVKARAFDAQKNAIRTKLSTPDFALVNPPDKMILMKVSDRPELWDELSRSTN